MGSRVIVLSLEEGHVVMSNSYWQWLHCMYVCIVAVECLAPLVGRPEALPSSAASLLSLFLLKAKL
jgi:hypothetical protein